MFFSFPEDAHWRADQQAVEFGVEIGEYHGVVRVPQRVFQRLLPDQPTPERCVGHCPADANASRARAGMSRSAVATCARASRLPST